VHLKEGGATGPKGAADIVLDIGMLHETPGWAVLTTGG
jgi:hypothetical protein